MFWVVFEVLLAFAIAVGIVWWTWPKSKRAIDELPAEQRTADGGSSAEPSERKE